MMETKKSRVLDIFLKGLMGEQLSTKELAKQYEVSTKSIMRDFAEIRAYLAEHRHTTGNAELTYSNQTKTYSLTMDRFLSGEEVFAIVEILLASRMVSQVELAKILKKLKEFTTPADCTILNAMIDKELIHYTGVQVEIPNVGSQLWRLAKLIYAKKEITIRYKKMDLSVIERRILPLSLLFSDYYFYLIAYHKVEEEYRLRYYRLDRIQNIVEHRTVYRLPRQFDFDEGELRKKIQFMWPGKCRKIRFKFTGPSVQAILDRLPTARIVEINTDGYLVEAEVYGDGILMYLLSQREWVTVLEPEEVRLQMKDIIYRMYENYC